MHLPRPAHPRGAQQHNLGAELRDDPLELLEVWGDGGEMVGRWWGDGGEVAGRWPGGGGEMPISRRACSRLVFDLEPIVAQALGRPS